MVTSPYEWKFLEWDEKSHQNKKLGSNQRDFQYFDYTNPSLRFKSG